MTDSVTDVFSEWDGNQLAPSYWSRGKLEVPLVYFIKSECGPIKIGMSVAPEVRLHTMQAASPSKLAIAATVQGGKPVEREYHQRFAVHRLWGEWFTPAEEILAEIERLGEVHLHFDKRQGSIATSSPCPLAPKKWAITRD